MTPGPPLIQRYWGLPCWSFSTRVLASCQETPHQAPLERHAVSWQDVRPRGRRGVGGRQTPIPSRRPIPEGVSRKNVAPWENSPARQGGVGRVEIAGTLPSRAGLSANLTVERTCSGAIPEGGDRSKHETSTPCPQTQPSSCPPWPTTNDHCPLTTDPSSNHERYETLQRTSPPPVGPADMRLSGVAAGKDGDG